MTKTATYQIRVMTRSEVDTAVEWAAQEGWNPDFTMLTASTTLILTVSLWEKLDGEPVACISAITYRENFGFMGFYTVKAEYREWDTESKSGTGQWNICQAETLVWMMLLLSRRTIKSQVLN